MLQFFIDSLKKQTFNILILCGVIYWFNLKYDALDLKYETLNLYVRDRFEQVIDKNTEALLDFKKDKENVHD
jgi:hypothetical protein